MAKHLTIGWKVSTLNPALASLRYRAMMPLLALEKFDIKSNIFNTVNRSHLDDLDVLVIVKSFTLDDYWLAQEAVELKVPVVFDLCDNIFIEKYMRQYLGKKEHLPADIFLLIARVATAITVSTEPLATVVREQVDGRIPVYVVPDGIESKAVLVAIKKRLFKSQIFESSSYLKLKNRIAVFLRKVGIVFKTGSIMPVLKKVIRVKAKSFKRYLAWKFYAKSAYRHYDYWRARLTGASPKSNPQVRKKDRSSIVQPKKVLDDELTKANSSQKILWFGRHGAAHAQFGMLDLLAIKEPLEKLASELPVELIVVSNNPKKYEKYISSMSIPSRYYAWSASTMDQYFHDAAVVVLPNSLDDFSICKSPNRTVLALSNGVPVVATATPALEALRDCIILDDFEKGLRCYLTDPGFSAKQVKKGQERIEQLYGQQAIGRLWRGILDEVIYKNDLREEKVKSNIDIIFLVQLLQDVDLLLPILDEASEQGLHFVIWISLSAIKRWPRLLDVFQNSDFSFQIIPDELKGVGTSIFPASAFALLSVTESNLSPHAFTFKLTKLANSAGLYTTTMQHGYENIGLTYSDEIHDINRIRFASRQIYTWGGRETLHPNIPLKTRMKCFPVGYPKLDKVQSANVPDELRKGSVVIGIFENLHWHRYSEEYRTSFIEGINHVADIYPEVIFLLKPHNAGTWLTEHYKGEKLERGNVIIADPSSSQWIGSTAPQLFDHLNAVITTPSTVALDAARVKIPTTVVAQDLDLKGYYDPLPLIKNLNGWSAFISQILNDQKQTLFRKRSQQFVERVLLSGDKAAWRIIDDMRSRKVNYNQDKVKIV